MLAHRHPVRAGTAVPRERGETLIEVLVAMILLGTVMVSVLVSLLSLVRTADLNQEKTRASIGVQTYAERLKQPVEDFAYISCRTAAGTQTAAQVQTSYEAKLTGSGIAAALPSGYSGSIRSVTFLDPATGAFGSTCASPSRTQDPLDTNRRDGGAQKITLRVQSGRTGTDQAVEDLVIIKRDARCSTNSVTGYANIDAGPC